MFWVLALFFWICFGIIAGQIAANKGLGGCGWAMFGFLLPILALPLVLLAKPDRLVLEQRALGWDSVRCPHCAEIVRREAKVCRFCGRDLPAPTTPAVPPRAAYGGSRRAWLAIGIVAAAMVTAAVVIFLMAEGGSDTSPPSNDTSASALAQTAADDANAAAATAPAPGAAKTTPAPAADRDATNAAAAAPPEKTEGSPNAAAHDETEGGDAGQQPSNAASSEAPPY